MNKKKYIVGVREVHVSSIVVYADNEEHAYDLAQGGSGNEVMCEYSHTLERDSWTIERVGKE